MKEHARAARMARQFAETEPGFKDFIMALADKLSNG